jgi:hypothetical protein
MDPFNTLSTAAAVRMIPPQREASPAKVASCALVASTDLEKALDAVKEVTGGSGTPSAMMAGQPAMVGGCMTPLEVGEPSPAHQSSPAAQGCGSRPVHALSPPPTIGKEHHSATPTRLSMGVLTPKKITIRCQLVVPSSNNDDDLPLVKHDARVDLNSGGMRMRYTQEPALMSDSPP